MAWWDDEPRTRTADEDDPYYAAQEKYATPDPWKVATAELDAEVPA